MRIFTSRQLLPAVLLVSAHMAHFSPIAQANNGSMPLPEAQAVIQSYRALRDACAQGSYDARRTCINTLSQANAQYRLAKTVIAQHKAPHKNTVESQH